MPQRWDQSRGALRAILPILIGCAVLAASLASAPNVQGATRTWDGGGGDGLWSTAANWTADTVPIAGDTVTFNGTSTTSATIDMAVTVAIFQVNAGYTGTITQAAGQPLDITTSYTQSAGTFAGGASTITVTGTTTVNAGGTFNGGTSTISLNGALTVAAGGAFTSTSGTMTLTGALTLAAGVFTHNSGTVIFSTSNVTLNLGGAATFNNVQFASGTKTFSAANTMTVAGTLTLAGGTVNTGTIAAQGSIDTQAGFAGGTTILLINGTTPQTWSGTAGGATDLLPVNINNPASTLTITASLRTTRNWTFTASGGLTASGS
ncbi:MAG: autotransporter adhesin family protein, partial [Chloroflexota bacterium]|nr:autotransporter adhesin family protein [Chloroflexota bacterium]